MKSRTTIILVSIILFALLTVIYHVRENSYATDVLYKGHRIVHLDLKGAPPTIKYYKYLFPLLKKLGATGLLVEYEDMLPFEGDNAGISARNSYSKSDVMAIQKIAEANGLLVIPLIQTFGHLEFVLKLKNYVEYREVRRYPQAVCPTYNKTVHLLKDMIDQVIAMHPKTKYLHIGADEVYQLGKCDRCLAAMSKRQWTKQQLFLNHVHVVASYIKGKYPHLTVLMWDDEFREIDPQDIIDKGLNKLVEPVVWKYTRDPASTLTDRLWQNYARVWKSVWVATAFKGATAPSIYYADTSYHMENHQRWLEIISRQSKRINFRGVILTGWQRYDHFSVLCELLPVALPSLALSLMILQPWDCCVFATEVPARIMDILNCDDTIDLTLPEPQYGWTRCSYFGASLYTAMFRFYFLHQDINKVGQSREYKGWLNPFNVKHAFSNPSYVERTSFELDRYKMELIYIEKEIISAMEGIYTKDTVQEWLETYLKPLNDTVMVLWNGKENILNKNSWPRRPLTMASEL